TGGGAPARSVGRRDASAFRSNHTAGTVGQSGRRRRGRPLSPRERLRHGDRARGRRRSRDPVSEPTGAVVMRDVVVVGGGCYGSFYAAQLAKAKARGKADYRSVIVVDRNARCRARAELGEAPDRRFVTEDWSTFFDAYLPE